LSELLKRTLTGILIVVFVLGGFWLHPVSFFITGLVILTGTQYEYYNLIRKSGINPQMIPGLATGITAYTASTLVAMKFISINWFCILIPAVPIIMILELYRKEEMPFNSIAHTLLPFLYIVLPLSLLPFTAFNHSGIKSLLSHEIVFSPGVIVGFLLLLWTNDTAAYLAGVSFGHHRLFERISPKKSWEGFISGFVFTVAVACLLPGWLGVFDRIGWIATAVIIVAGGTYGDLIESLLKRSMGLKDSGNIMPGHGGFLDRFDSMMISFPLVYLYFTLFG